MPQANAQLSEDNIKDAAKAIMTTDTKPKMRSVVTYIGDKKIVISAIAKGAGMVAPNLQLCCPIFLLMLQLVKMFYKLF